MTVSTIRLVGMLTLLALGSTAYAGGPGDTDGDGVLDAFDNCINVFNPAQRDTDGDGFGNFCDPDFNNDGIVNFPDLGIFKAGIFGTDPDLDLDGDGIVNFADLQIVKSFFFGPPGPSAPNTPPTGLAIDNNSVDENEPAGTAVGTFSTTDPNPGNTHTYTLVAGAGDTDNAQFTIVGDVLQTAAVLNHEAADNCVTSADTCSIRVQTEDNFGGTFQQSLIININDINDAPVITSDGGGDNATVNAAENQTAVTTVTATDEDLPAQNLTFSISGGADAGAFSIGAASGVLTFSSAPNFENPTDAGGDNTYDVQVTVTDDGAPNLSDVQNIAATVTDVNDAPVITSDGGGDNASVNAPEEQTAVTTVTATDEDLPAQNLTFSISGGADAGAFSIGAASGVLTFSSAPDFENPTDSGGDNIYDVQVTVTDDGAPNLSDAQDIAVTVTDQNENSPPVITSDGGGDNASVNAAENQTAVTTVTATDPESPPQVLSFSISGGADAGAFSIGAASGVLTFSSAPNFENPTDSGGDNVYDVEVTVTDDGAPTQSDSQNIAVTVTDANDDPTDIALSNANVDENEAIGTAVGTFTTTDEDTGDSHTYSLVSGTGDADNGAFMIAGDQLQTAAVLNHEATDNCITSASTCSIRVQTDDGNGGQYSESFIITINNVNDAPVAVGDPYSGAIGNTRFALVTSLSGTTPVPPTVELVGDIDANDTDEDTADTISVTANPSIATSQGGTVSVDANGQFVYSPPAGFPGTGIDVDTFTYELCDNGAPVLCDNGTVTIEGSDIVWYVDDSSPNNPGTGTSDDPFRDLSSASGAPTAAGETIFVFAGTHTTNISLLNNQSLLGEGVGLTVGPTTLVDPGVRPVVTTTGTAITLAQSNTVRGIDITNSNTGISGNTFGTLTGDSIAITTTGGPGIDLTSGAGSITFDSVSSSVSSGAGIDLDSVSGTFTFGSGSISGSTGNGIDITSSTASISYGGTVTAGSGLAVNVSGHSANGVDLSGLILSTGQGILLNNNTGGTITFRGGMDLDTGASSALSATNGGTVNVCADTNCEAAGGTPVSNLVATTTATAVAINTTIGAGGVTFDDVEVTGPTSQGIDIANAGSGGFTVNGGMISNTTGNGIRIDNTDNIAISFMSLTDAADDGGAGCSTVAFNCNAAIEFNSVSTVDLANVTITRSDEHGIFGTNVTDLDLTNVSITDAGNGTDSSEHGIFIRNLLGTVAGGTDSRFDNVDIDDSASNGIFVENTLGTSASAAQPDLLTITGTSSVSNHGQNSGIIVETDAAAANLKLDVQSGYQSTNNSTRGISINANAGRLQADVDGATFGGGGHFKAIGGGSAAAGADSELIVNLTNNNITQSGAAGTGPGGISFSSFSTGPFDGTMRGTIQGNFITSAGNTLSGLTLTNEGNGTANRFLIDDNEIQLPAAGSSGLEGMRLVSRIGTGGRMDLIITNNIVNIPNNTDDFTGGIVTIAGNSGGSGTNTLCVKMANNDVDTPAKDAMWGSQHEYALIAWTGNTMIIDSLVAEGLPVTDAGMGTYVSPGAPNNPGSSDGVNVAGFTSIGINSAVQLLGATLLDGTCIAP